MKSIRCVFLFFMLAFGWQSVCAQVNASSLLSATSDKVTSTNYYFARPNEITIVVNVMGFVQRPGRYEIASTINLVDLLALAGGPTADGALDKIKISRMIKEGKDIHYQEVHLDLVDLTEVKTEDLLLVPGDVVEVDRTGWSVFRDAFGIVVSAAAITVAVTQVILVTRNR